MALLNKKLSVLLIAAAVLTTLVLLFSNRTIKSYMQNVPTIKTVFDSPKRRNLHSIKVGDTKILVELAETPAQKAQGLSGRESLNENEGMLFVFENKTRPSFWMKDMIIPIDIIWIAYGKIVGIEKNVQPPEKGTSNSKLNFYKPPTGIDYVLEVNAGFSGKNGIRIDNSVNLLDIANQ